MKLDLSAPGPAGLRLSALLEAAGTLGIDDGHIVFTKAPGLRGWGAPAGGVRLALRSALGVRVAGGALTVQDGAQEWVFTGAYAAQLGLGLLAGGMLGPDGAPDPGRLWGTSATLVAGMLRGAGLVVVGRAGVRFGTTGALSETLGVPSWSCAWRWLTAVTVTGRRVLLRGLDGEVAFEVDDPAALAQTLSMGMAVPPAVHRPPAAIWLGGGVLQLASGEVRPGLAWVDPDGVLRFLSAEGERVLGPSDRAQRLSDRRADALRDHQDAWVLRLRSPGEVEGFEREVVRVLGPHRSGALRADLRLVVGRRERVRFRDERGSRPTIPMVWIEDGERELDLFCAPTDGVPPVGEAIQLVVHARSGDMRLLTRCAAVDELPIHEAPRGAQNALKGAPVVVRVRLRRPLATELQELKDRGGFRFELGLLEAHLQRERSPASPVQIVDLSASGAAVRVTELLPIGTALWLHVPLPELAQPARVEVVWAKVVAEHPHVGVRFMDESEHFRARVQRAIYRMQRAQLEVAGDEATTDAPSGDPVHESPTGMLRALAAAGA
jgi:hypothetical protein